MTPEQEALLQKADRSIRSAKLLLADGDYDSAVSRSYYAMFYLVEALLLSNGLAFSKHSAVIGAFGREFAKTGLMPQHLHTYLQEAFEARNISDYKSASMVTESETAKYISRAEEFLGVAGEFLGPRHRDPSEI